MPVYCFKCSVCGHEFDTILSIKDRMVDQPCLTCGGKTEKMITKVNFNLVGDNWPSKAYRIKEQGLKRREVMTKRMETRIKDQPLATLVPNVGGEETGSWSEARKLAASKGKDSSSYQSMVDKETKR